MVKKLELGSDTKKGKDAFPVPSRTAFGGKVFIHRSKEGRGKKLVPQNERKKKKGFESKEGAKVRLLDGRFSGVWGGKEACPLIRKGRKKDCFRPDGEGLSRGKSLEQEERERGAPPFCSTWVKGGGGGQLSCRAERRGNKKKRA